MKLTDFLLVGELGPLEPLLFFIFSTLISLLLLREALTLSNLISVIYYRPFRPNPFLLKPGDMSRSQDLLDSKPFVNLLVSFLKGVDKFRDVSDFLRSLFRRKTEKGIFEYLAALLVSDIFIIFVMYKF